MHEFKVNCKWPDIMTTHIKKMLPDLEFDRSPSLLDLEFDGSLSVLDISGELNKSPSSDDVS